MSKNRILISSLVFTVIVAIAAGIYAFTSCNRSKINVGTKVKILSANDASQKALTYIKKNLLQGNVSASVSNVKEKSGVYKMDLKIGKKEYESYVTKDGKYLFIQAFDLNPPKPKTFTKTQKPDVKLFVMSFCPYGNQAEELIMPVVKLLGSKANISLHYILYSNYASGYPNYCIDKDNQYCSMHGIQEIHQDIRELCVAKYQNDKLWDFVNKINNKANARNVDTKWENIARDIGIDVAKVKKCQKEEGIALLKQELDETSQSYLVQNPSRHQGSEKESISGSPTLVINGMIYDGERNPEAFKKAICSAFVNSPKECRQKLIQNSPSRTSNSGGCKK